MSIILKAHCRSCWYGMSSGQFSAIKMKRTHPNKRKAYNKIQIQYAIALFISHGNHI